MIEKLYSDFCGDLLRFCVRLTGSQAEAEDLVQESYLRAMTHLEDLERLEKCQQRSWLYRTARNLHIDCVRKRAREVCGGEEPQLPFEEDFGRIAVGQLIGRLPESERGLFAMRYFEGYNAAELGEIFHLPSSTVRARLASARKKMLGWYKN